MDTRSLYLKYRPEVFADVIGQDHVVSVLTRSLEEDKLAHAYLFYGGRGTGKTSVARILAKSLGVSGNDLYEIDAASNNSVEDIRILRESVSTLPFEGKYKMYILDEVHMLSKAAFNALLKTLEEPPEHVIFILATTELEKVPDTIASRCQVFTFKKPTELILAKLAENVAKKEGFLLGSGVPDLVAILGDGSFRDTQGILQKVLTYSKDKKISLEEVEKVTGAPSKTLVHEYISAIVLSDLEKGLSVVESVSKNAIDPRVFMKLVLHTFRTVLLLRVSPNLEPALRERVSETDIELARELIANGGKVVTSKTLQTLLLAYNQTRHSAISQIPLELALIEIIGEAN